MRVKLQKKSPRVENYKTLLREILEDLNKWRDSPCSWIGIFNIVKKTIISTLIYGCNAISFKFPRGFFCPEIDNLIPKTVWTLKWSRITKAILKFTITLLIKILVLALMINIYIKGTELNPVMNSYVYGELIFNKHTKEIHWKNDSPFNKWFW